MLLEIMIAVVNLPVPVVPTITEIITAKLFAVTRFVHSMCRNYVVFKVR